jgi:IS30 family transposase
MISGLSRIEESTLASHLTLSERRIIAGMLQRKISVAQIAVQLGRHRSTIHREIGRNFWHDPEVPMATGYWRMNAQHLADGRRKRQAKILQDDDLRGGVIAGLEAGWSPQQIAGRMRHEGARRRVCHETIYRYVYSSEGGHRNWPAIFPSGGASESHAMRASREASSFPSAA